jgi:excisionase family DNA binding protein
MDTLMTTGDAARILNRSTEAVRMYERSGKLPALKTANGQRLFKEADVRKLATKLEAKSAEHA